MSKNLTHIELFNSSKPNRISDLFSHSTINFLYLNISVHEKREIYLNSEQEFDRTLGSLEAIFTLLVTFSHLECCILFKDLKLIYLHIYVYIYKSIYREEV